MLKFQSANRTNGIIKKTPHIFPANIAPILYIQSEKVCKQGRHDLSWLKFYNICCQFVSINPTFWLNIILSCRSALPNKETMSPYQQGYVSLFKRKYRAHVDSALRSLYKSNLLFHQENQVDFLLNKHHVSKTWIY